MRGDGEVEEILLLTEGSCMRPWLWPGGRLQVRRCTVEQLSIADIAVWFDGKRLLSHRVVELRGNGEFVTRGDLEDQPDPPAQRQQLVGRAVAFRMGLLAYRLDEGPVASWGALMAPYSRGALCRA